MKFTSAPPLHSAFILICIADVHIINVAPNSSSAMAQEKNNSEKIN